MAGSTPECAPSRTTIRRRLHHARRATTGASRGTGAGAAATIATQSAIGERHAGAIDEPTGVRVHSPRRRCRHRNQPRRRLPWPPAVPATAARRQLRLAQPRLRQTPGAATVSPAASPASNPVPKSPIATGLRAAAIENESLRAGTGDGTARNGDPRRLRDVSQRRHGAGQAGQAPGDFRVLRHLPPDDGVDPRDLHTHRRHAEHLRVLPQRYEREGQAVRPFRHVAVLRLVPPDDGVVAFDRVPASVAGVQASYGRGEVRELPHDQRRSGGLEIGCLQARLRGLPRQCLQAGRAREGGIAARPVHGSRTARLQRQLPRVCELVALRRSRSRRPATTDRRTAASDDTTCQASLPSTSPGRLPRSGGRAPRCGARRRGSWRCSCCGADVHRGGCVGAAHRHGRRHARRQQRGRAHRFRRADPVPPPRAGERGQGGAGLLPDHGPRRGVGVRAGGAAPSAAQQSPSRTDRHLSGAAARPAAAARRRIRVRRAVPPSCRGCQDDRHHGSAVGRADRASSRRRSRRMADFLRRK